MWKKVILVTALILSAAGQYYTSTDRTEAVNDLCASFSDRTSLVDTQSVKENESYKEFLKTQLTADGYFHINPEMGSSKVFWMGLLRWTTSPPRVPK